MNRKVTKGSIFPSLMPMTLLTLYLCQNLSILHSFPISPIPSRTFRTNEYIKHYFSTALSNDHEISTSPSQIQKILDSVQKDHDEEVERGKKLFDIQEDKVPFNTSMEEDKQQIQWSDNDFISYDVGVGNAGPDEFRMKRANEVFATVNPVFTAEECDALISEAKLHIEEGLKSESLQSSASSPKSTGRYSTRTSNSALGEAKVSDLPKALSWLKLNMKNKLLPLLESRFGLTDLTLNDALIIGYGYFDQEAGAPSQPIHRDASLVSLNIALSPMINYEGGGTYFEGLNVGPKYSDRNTGEGPIKMERGHVLCHSSGSMHAGNGLQRGQRWVLVLFCLAKSIPQYARRCHAEGMKMSMDGDLESAKATFEAGISKAPNDHLLHMSLGRIFATQGDELKSREYLERVADLYKLDPSPLIALGKMYFEERKAYQAFCRFDKALSLINNADLSENTMIPLKAALWDARVLAGRCAVICAEQEAAMDYDKNICDEAKHAKSERRPFACQYLPEAINRITIARKAAPQDDRLTSLLTRAEELYNDAISK